jgi:hypothetical protein
MALEQRIAADIASAAKQSKSRAERTGLLRRFTPHNGDAE